MASAEGLSAKKKKNPTSLWSTQMVEWLSGCTSPIERASSPSRRLKNALPIDQLTDVRRTVARKTKGAAYVAVADDWRTAEAGERLFEDDSSWAGRTIFT